MNLPDPEDSSEVSVSTECFSKRTEGNEDQVPGHSAGYAYTINDIHLYSAVSNWMLLSNMYLSNYA